MSDELPTFRTVRCNDCNQLVELGRNSKNQLLLACDCGSKRAVKVKSVLPDGWQA